MVIDINCSDKKKDCEEKDCSTCTVWKKHIDDTDQQNKFHNPKAEKWYIVVSIIFAIVWILAWINC